MLVHFPSFSSAANYLIAHCNIGILRVLGTWDGAGEATTPAKGGDWRNDSTDSAAGLERLYKSEI